MMARQITESALHLIAMAIVDNVRDTLEISKSPKDLTADEWAASDAWKSPAEALSCSEGDALEAARVAFGSDHPAVVKAWGKTWKRIADLTGL